MKTNQIAGQPLTPFTFFSAAASPAAASLSSTATTTGSTGSTEQFVQADEVNGYRQHGVSVDLSRCHAPRGFPLTHGDPLPRYLATMASKPTEARCYSGEDTTGSAGVSRMQNESAPRGFRSEQPLRAEVLDDYMLMSKKSITLNEVSVRLKASRSVGESNMKQRGVRTAKNWCSATAEYHEIKRLAAFREELGDSYRETVEEFGIIAIADNAVAGGKGYSWEEAYLFWESVGATQAEIAEFVFLNAFIEGCELFWTATAKYI